MSKSSQTKKQLFDVDVDNDPLFGEYERSRALINGPDRRRALKELEILAHRGSIMSLFFVSDAMRDGWEYDQNLPRAEAWYRVAVESGSARGIFSLGLTHLLMHRFDEAIEELEAAISRDYPPAYNSLAGVYLRGDGVPVDRQRAIKLLRKGSMLGHLPAKRNLIRQLIHGSCGFEGRIEGFLGVLPYAIDIGRLKAKDVDTDRLR